MSRSSSVHWLLVSFVTTGIVAGDLVLAPVASAQSNLFKKTKKKKTAEDEDPKKKKRKKKRVTKKPKKKKKQRAKKKAEAAKKKKAEAAKKKKAEAEKKKKAEAAKKKADAEKKKAEAEPPPPPPPPEKTEEEKRIEAEKARVEAAKKKLTAEGRKKSRVTEGTPSRWSNRGAMVPVVAEVPVTAPLPTRNVPRPIGVETPGQKLFEKGEVLSARLALSGFRLATAGQDITFFKRTQLQDQDRDIELLRGRATMAYQNIGGADVGAHLDLEYRPSQNTPRFTDQRVNELYVSYGLTSFRNDRSNLPFGIALGRLAIREAGYAQADGLAFRLRVIEELDVGLFGGITGNPYGYNWNLRNSEFISTDWYTGGLFSSVRVGPFAANVAAVMTYANPNALVSGLDRLYTSLDLSYVVSPELNFYATGIVDLLPSGQLVQNLDVTGSYSPTPDISLSASLGRFSTIIYEQSAGYTYSVDPNGNTFTDNRQNDEVQRVVGENGQPIIPFDAAIYSTVYNQLRVRGGYRVLRELELFARVNAVLRDFSATEDALAEDAAIVQQLDAVPFRMLPSVGGRFRDPKIVDANLEATFVIDGRSNTNAIFAAGVGREFYGLYGGVDGRYFLGDVNGLDGGVNISYTLPRDLLPGLFLIRATARYFLENLALVRPVDNNPDNNVLVGTQKTTMFFGGVEWRL